jgi:sugar phosphate isomerase/epimerase
MRDYSLAYLTVNQSSVAEAFAIAAQWGYGHVGLRLLPNGPGAPHQAFIEDPVARREALAARRDLPVAVFDLEIVRIGAEFDPRRYEPLFEAGAALGARAVLVAGDDDNPARLASHFAALCDCMRPYGLTADLEFMPWTAVRHAREALAIVNAAGTPANAGILVDALHVGRSQTRLEDIASLPRALLHYAQWCDAEPGTHFSTEALIHTAREERLPPGEGGIDLTGLARALPADLPISVEVPHMRRQREMGDAAWARLCLEATRRHLGEGA